ncbi:zinc-binding dehydrogenase [Halioglobus japonicus]|uniref:NADPH:quinone reductase n=1 Tax=Halioglobus japonicus TaxID=930805 RepID=A0AAP8ME51_9GAMM|nr:NADPH:quinone reductase [Halioglobus japonicus]AQA18167.1 zinc-binding dehydrogenase [Halioglobus japonicus]PLW86168.1 NADPH:quinone reductase [Halioglobus japonicus]GHD14092.1 NADPH:quinone oxidoreductase [Halioglobus japonicus]
MKAAWFESFGSAQDALILGDQPTPQPAPGEVLVRLHTTGVNPSDVKKRAGAFPNLLDGGLVIPHSDGAGVIEAVGEGVDASRIGERVFVYQAQYGRRLGTAAEYVALDAALAPKLPDEASFEVGACIGIPMMTAHRCVFADGDVNGQTILVTGGAGRVGYYAIQWAAQAGARVIATASNDADAALCRDMGASEVVNHREENWGEQVVAANGGEKVDRVVEVEFGVNLPEVLKCVRIGATIATYSSTVVPEPSLPFRDMMFMDLTLRMVIVYAMPEQAKEDAIRDTSEALAAGRLQHRIAHSVPFAEMARSHELIEQGGFGGCVVVRIND